MKKFIILIVLIFQFVPQNLKAQNDGAVTAAAIGGLLAIGAGVAAVEQMKEQAELTATQWILTNQPNMNSFSLKTLDFDGKKLKDMSFLSKFRSLHQQINQNLMGRSKYY